jgi:transketolase
LSTTDLDTLSVNTIRGLCMDEVQKANSGHPGTPMGIAPVAYTLWQRFLRFDPSDPIWPNRDRFVQLLANFGFTPEHLSQVARELVAAARERSAS